MLYLHVLKFCFNITIRGINLITKKRPILKQFYTIGAWTTNEPFFTT